MFFVLGVFIFVPLFFLLSVLLSLAPTSMFWNLVLFVTTNILSICATVVYFTYCQDRKKRDIIDITRIEDEIKFWTNLKNQVSHISAPVDSTETKTNPIEEIRQDIETNLTSSEESVDQPTPDQPTPDQPTLDRSTPDQPTLDRTPKIDRQTEQKNQVETDAESNNAEESSGQNSPLRRRSRKDD